jgi:hypothetical protein
MRWQRASRSRFPFLILIACSILPQLAVPVEGSLLLASLRKQQSKTVVGVPKKIK